MFYFNSISMERMILFGKKFSGLFFAWVLSASCASGYNIIPVKGHGPAIERTFNLSDFKMIDVSGGFDVILVQGDREMVVVKAQDNLFEYISVSVVAGELHIATERPIMPTEPIQAIITFVGLEQVNVSGGGDLTAKTRIDVPALRISMSGGGDVQAGFTSNMVRCHLSGGGDARLNGKIESLHVELNGGGDLDSEIESREVDILLSGGGNADLKHTGEADKISFQLNGGGNLRADLKTRLLQFGISGGGDAHLAGEAGDSEMRVNGGGDVFAEKLVTRSTRFQVSGGSDLHVMATGELSGKISGGGNVYLAGDPPVVSIDATGGSKIQKL